MSSGKWALIDSDLNQISDFIFDDIILDEYETCVGNSAIFAQKGGKYYLYSTSGKQLTLEGYDDAYPFVSTYYAAVKKDDKWGFISSDGTEVLDFIYDDAKSFSANGLAPVNEAGEWKYIALNGDVMVTGLFEDCKPFAANGVAAVKEDGVWNYIMLYINYYG